MIAMPQKLITLACLTLTLCLAACAAPQTPTAPIHAAAPQESRVDVQSMIERARSLPSPQAEALLVEAANHLIDEGKLKEAARILNPIDSSALPVTVKSDHVLALARLAMARGKFA